MPTTPEQVRAGLQVVTSAAQADIRTVAEAAESPEQVRAALFAAAPLIVGDYIDGAAALALDWYEELRDLANPPTAYGPTSLTLVTDDMVSAMVAATTEVLRDIEAETEALLREITEQAVADVAAGVQKQVASGFWDTVTGNAAEDPAAAGWKRFARPEACKFCLMLAARGAVYTRETARFAAHGAITGGKRTGGDCMCIAGPEFGGQDEWAEATPMQYMASKRRRTAKERAALRDYLNENFPDAPG